MHLELCQYVAFKPLEAYNEGFVSKMCVEDAKFNYVVVPIKALSLLHMTRPTFSRLLVLILFLFLFYVDDLYDHY